MVYITKFGVSLFLTLILEIGLAILLGIRKKSLLPVVLVNIITNPVVVLLDVIYDLPLGWILVLEAVVIGIEGLIYYLFDKREGYEIKAPFLKALVLNVFSYTMGLAINYLDKVL